MSRNVVVLSGFLGADPELKTFGETTVCRLRLATDDFVNGQKVTSWHRVALFGRKAETAAQYNQKGSYIEVQGRIRYRRYTSNKDGIERQATEISAYDWSGPGARINGNGQAAQPHPEQPVRQAQPAQQAQPQASSRSSGLQGYDDFDDDIPF
jgi:single-strand DNA-binding protein